VAYNFLFPRIPVVAVEAVDVIGNQLVLIFFHAKAGESLLFLLESGK
jgi:hypothetical protein